MRLIAELPIRPRRELVRKASAFWNAQFGSNDTVLGVHLRGTDKPWAVGLNAYLPLVSAFLCHSPAASVFVATDDRRRQTLD